MRKEDIQELFEEIEGKLDRLRKYKKITQAKFKSVLGHLRSTLDYMAVDINEKLPKPKPKQQVYFPYGKTKEDFEKSINKNLPNLIQEFPEIYKIIERVQFHISNNDDLILMCNLNNKAKHQELIGIENKGNDEVVISSGGIPIFGFVNSKNSIIKGPRILVRNEDGTLTDQGMMGTYHIDGTNVKVIDEENPLIDFKITDEKKLVIDGYPDKEVIAFIESCLGTIKCLYDDVYAELEKK